MGINGFSVDKVYRYNPLSVSVYEVNASAPAEWRSMLRFLATEASRYTGPILGIEEGKDQPPEVTELSNNVHRRVCCNLSDPSRSYAANRLGEQSGGEAIYEGGGEEFEWTCPPARETGLSRTDCRISPGNLWRLVTVRVAGPGEEMRDA